MKKNVLLFHLCCFSGTVFIISFFLFYQVFVDPAHRRIPLVQFLKPRTLIEAVKKLQAPKEPLVSSVVFWRSKEGDVINFEKEGEKGSPFKSLPSLFLINSKKYFTTIDSGVLTVVDGNVQYQVQLSLNTDTQFTVLGWLDEKQLIVAEKQDGYQILKVNLDTVTTEVLISDISYSGDSLPVTSNGKLATLVYPDCEKKCYFIVYDLIKNTVSQKIPAFTDPGHSASLSDVKLLFTDQKTGYIGYEVPNSNEIYIIDHNLNFLQYIRLENDSDEARYEGYFPQTEQLLFSLLNRDGSQQTMVLVAANNPSLHILTKSPTTGMVQVSPFAGVYQLNQTLYDLNGNPIKNLLPLESLVPAY